MSENKMTPTSNSTDELLSSLNDSRQVEDSKRLIELFQEITNEKPVMWGMSIIGFGQARLTYASGREVDWPKVGFSPRKGKISLYVTFDAASLTSHFPNLGKYKIGKGCIYINKLADVNEYKLKQLIRVGYEAGFQSSNRSDGKEQIVTVRE